MTSSEPPPGLEGGGWRGMKRWSREDATWDLVAVSGWDHLQEPKKHIPSWQKRKFHRLKSDLGWDMLAPPQGGSSSLLSDLFWRKQRNLQQFFFVGCMAWDSFLTHTKNNWRGKIFKQMRRGQAAFENTCSFWHCCWFSINSDSRCHMFFLGRFNVGTPKLLRTVQVWFPPKSNIDTQIWWVF